jgi:SAM-dependent methyltransferase
MLLNRYCAVDGRVVIIHSGFQGVASMVEAALGTSPFVTAEQIAAGLISSGLRPTRHVLSGRLCIEDAITDSSLGRALLGFIVEREPLSEEVRELLVKEMVARSIVVDGARWIPEDLLVLEVRSRLRPVAPTAQREVVDSVQDYHVLAEAFNWDERLRSLPSGNGAPPFMLDVGCGTGRWLRVLASAFPELATTQRCNIIYDRVDPSTDALAPNAVIASELFTLGTTWCEGIEEAALPVNRYGLIWAVHSLYGVPEVKVEGVLRRLMDSVARDGFLIVILGDPGSFYLEAKPNLVGGRPFTSSHDVLLATERLGLSTTVTNIRYTESFGVGDEDSIRRYVWHEAIGNTYLPAGLSGESLPELPSGEWWESYRCGDFFEFVQSVSVIVIEGN